MPAHGEPGGPVVTDPASGERRLEPGGGRTDGPDQGRHLSGSEAERAGDLLGSTAAAAEFGYALHEFRVGHSPKALRISPNLASASA
jgi:hypothetical protein